MRNKEKIILGQASCNEMSNTETVNDLILLVPLLMEP